MQHENGFSLTELLVAMVISVIVMAAIYSAYVSQQKSYEITEAVSAVQQNLRASMYRMEREIRMAGYDPDGTASVGFHNITSSTDDNIEISWDGADGSNPDGSGDPGEHIYYKVEDNKLKRKIGAGGYAVIAEGISGVTFYFLSSSGVTTSSSASIRSVDITLRASQKGHTRELNTRILCRNMGL